MDEPISPKHLFLPDGSYQLNVTDACYAKDYPLGTHVLYRDHTNSQWLWSINEQGKISTFPIWIGVRTKDLPEYCKAGLLLLNL